MVQLVSALVAIQAISVTSAFSIHQKGALARTFYVALKFHPQSFERAVECATNYGRCNVDELLNLAKGELYLQRLFIRFLKLWCKLIDATMCLWIFVTGHSNRLGRLSWLFLRGWHGSLPKGNRRKFICKVVNNRWGVTLISWFFVCHSGPHGSCQRASFTRRNARTHALS